MIYHGAEKKARRLSGGAARRTRWKERGREKGREEEDMRDAADLLGGFFMEVAEAFREDSWRTGQGEKTRGRQGEEEE